MFNFFWQAIIACRASHVVLVVKNTPANAEDVKMWVQSLGWEDPLEEGMQPPSILAWRISMDRGAWRATAHRVTKSQTHWATLLSLSIFTLSWTYPCARHSVLFVLFSCLKKLNVMLWSSELWVIEIKCNSSWFQRLLFTSWAFQGVELPLRIRIEN